MQQQSGIKRRELILGILACLATPTFASGSQDNLGARKRSIDALEQAFSPDNFDQVPGDSALRSRLNKDSVYENMIAFYVGTNGANTVYSFSGLRLTTDGWTLIPRHGVIPEDSKSSGNEVRKGNELDVRRSLDLYFGETTNGRKYKVDLSFGLCSSAALDLAILKLAMDAEPVRPIRYTISSQVQENVIANAFYREGSLTSESSGRVTKVNDLEIYTNITGGPGYSGSIVTNKHGEIIAIITHFDRESYVADNYYVTDRYNIANNATKIGDKFGHLTGRRAAYIPDFVRFCVNSLRQDMANPRTPNHFVYERRIGQLKPASLR